MNQFIHNLQQLGYFPFYLFFGDGNMRMGDWAVAARGLPEPLQSLVQLFLLQKPVNPSQVKAVIGEKVLEELFAAEILKREGRKLVTNHFCLISFRSYIYFCQLNHPDPWAYYGDDSRALAIYQTAAPGGKVLDLCSGPGIQSLIASRAAKQVTGVEINPRAFKIARINQKLNGVGRHLKFVNSPLADFARRNRQKFDRIMFNPPLVPVPGNMEYPFVGDGGETGLDVTESILESFYDALTPEGRFEFIGMTLGTNQGMISGDPLLSLAKKHGLEGTIHILSRHRLDANNALVDTYTTGLALGNSQDGDQQQLREEILRQFKDANYDHFYLFYCSWSKPQARSVRRCSVIDLSFYYFGDWFV